MVDKLYPCAPTVTQEPAVNEAEIAARIIELRETGCPADYKHRKFKPGQPMTEAAIRSLATAGRDIPATVKRIYDEIEAERQKLRQITPVPFETQTAYVAALTAEARHLDPAKHLAGVKAEAGVSTWAELKVIYPTPKTEPVEMEP